MAKKLLCLVLSLLMVLAVLTSCSNSDDAIEDTVGEASRYTTTLNFWLITESRAIAKVSELMYDGFNGHVDYEHYSELSEADQEKYAPDKALYDTLSSEEKTAVAQLSAINKAINKITKDQFKTQIKFRYLLESEYYIKLEKAFADREKAKKDGTLQKAEISSEETVLNEYGIPELKYPTTPTYQVDIMYLGDAVKYRAYADAKLLEPLDSMLENSALQLSYFVNNVLMKSAKYYGLTYGIPNDHTMGEYVYLAVDTALASAYNYLPADFDASLYSETTYKFLNLVYNRAEEGLYPLYYEDDIDLEKLHYWSFDLSSDTPVLKNDQFSLFGGFYQDNNLQGDQIGFANLLTNQIYINNLKKQVYYKNTEGFATTDASAKTAMRVVKGGWEMKAELEAQGYTVLTVEAPRLTDEDVFDSMFAVGANSSDATRAMEIITYINTNTEFRNLLQYGIEGTNYTLKTTEDGEGAYAEETVDNVYKMDIRKTGNIFLAHPDSEENVAAWEFGKEQNLYVTAYPTVGLFFDMEDRELDKNSVNIVNAVSARLKSDVLDKMTTVDEVTDLAAEAIKYNKSTMEMASFLINLLGGHVTCEVGGVTTVITASMLADALTSVSSTDIPEEDPKEGEVFLMGPAALYREWRENSGVLDN